MSEELIEKYQDEVDWMIISGCQRLSEGFIEKFKYKVNWMVISIHQKLSEEFIENHQDIIDWYYISECQNLSEEFVRQWLNKTYVKQLNKNENLTFKIGIEKVLKIADNKEECVVCYNSTNTKTICSHMLCADCFNKLEASPYFRGSVHSIKCFSKS
jgi:hypothetical protein